MIVVDVMGENTLFAVLCAVMGMLALALMVLVGFLIMTKRAERKSLERYVYVREEVEKPRVVQNTAQIKQPKESKKQRHGKKNKNKNRQNNQ